jgi:hypothetical protein
MLFIMHWRNTMSHKTGAIASALGALIVLMGIVLYDAHFVEPPMPFYAEPCLEDFTVNVSALCNGGRRYGKGVIVENDGKTFILTSRMVFVDDHEKISVEFGTKGNWTVRGELVATNVEWGLACVAADPGWSVGCSINGLNVPPGTEVEMRGLIINTLEYISDDWVLVEGGVTGDDTGEPVWMNGELVGIIVGLNSVDRNQAIMVGIEAIREFVDTIGDKDVL